MVDSPSPSAVPCSVVVMSRDEAGRVEAVAELPSPADFRVDQLLTSEFFGLNTTTDPVAEKIFDEYYALLALPKRSLKLSLASPTNGSRSRANTTGTLSRSAAVITLSATTPLLA